MKIVFFDFEEWEKPFIDKSLNNNEISFCSESASVENAKEFSDAEVISVFIKSQLDADVLKQFPNLKLVTTRSTGFDHIDLDYCTSNGIQVSNVPSYGENTVAEHGLTLMLALAKRLPESIERVRSNSFSPEGLTGMDLKGKVLGVVGTGHIGQYMIKYGNGLQMSVIAFDVKENKELESELGFTYVPMEKIFASSDFISLHVPFNDATKHMINREAISKMKDGVVIINTARGGLIETDALFDGLRSGKIGGAGLDVLEEENFLAEELELLHSDTHADVDFKVALENHMMAFLPNVIITPHNAFNSKEALERIIETTVENILCYSKGSCQNIVKK